MKHLLGRFKKLITALVIGIVCIPAAVLAYNYSSESKIETQTLAVAAVGNELNKVSDKTITDIHKQWTVRFNSNIDVNSLLNSIEVKDLTDGTTLAVTTRQGEDNSSIKIVPPTQGYKAGHSYQVTVNKSIKSNRGKNLRRAGLMNFKVVDVSSGNYTASTKVLVSPVISGLKQITINSVNFLDVKKVKLSGSNKVYSIGEAMVSVIKENSTKVYFYGNDGVTVIAEGNLDLSKSTDNLTIKLVNQN